MVGKARAGWAKVLVFAVMLVLVFGQVPTQAIAEVLQPEAAPVVEETAGEKSEPVAEEPSDGDVSDAVVEEGTVEPEGTSTADDAVVAEEGAEDEGTTPEVQGPQAVVEGEPEAEADADTLAAPKTGDYNLYWYALIPGVTDDSSLNADAKWNGMGVSTIYDAVDPTSVPHSITIFDPADCRYASDKTGEGVRKTLYPNIQDPATGKWYTYAKAGSPEADKANTYTLTPIRVIVGDGANAGGNDYNPIVSNNSPSTSRKNNTYHIDNLITLNDTERIQYSFAVKDVNKESFELVDPEFYSGRVEINSNESIIKDKTPDVKAYKETGKPYVETTKVVNGITYDFTGWYRDQELTKPCDFSQPMTKNVTYYGSYVPRTGSLTLQKDVTGNVGDVTKHFTFTLTGIPDNTYGVEYGNVADGDTLHESWLVVSNGSAQIALKDNETAKILGLPAGAKVSIKETVSGNAGTSTTAKVGDGQPVTVASADGKTETAPVEAPIPNEKNGNITVLFTNNADLQPATGITTATTPMLGLLATAGVGAAVLIAQRKRSTRKSDSNAWKE